MDIKGNDSHSWLLPGSTTKGAGGLHDNYGRIRARSATGQGEGGGQITTRARSSSDITACPPNLSPTPQSRSVDDSPPVSSVKLGSTCRAYTCQIIILSSRIIGASSVWSDLGSASAGSEPPEEHWQVLNRWGRYGRGRDK